MRAEAIYIVVTPNGHVSTFPAFTMADATQRYMREWLPSDVKLDGYLADGLWRKFADAGYRVERVDLPENLGGSTVCIT